MLLVAGSGDRQIVARCCERAAAAGVRAEMTLAHARALLPNGQVVVESYTPQRDAAALHALAEWTGRFSPIVAPDAPDGLLLDVTGCARLFRGERRLLDRVIESVQRLGFAARAAIAPTFGSAWAVARFAPGDQTIIKAHELHQALRPLPVRALRLEADIETALAEIGIERIEHLLALARRDLADRFDGQLVRRLDQAFGRVTETIEPVRPVAPPTAERIFDGPCKQFEAIALTVQQLIDQLCAQLQERESGARRIDWELDRADAAPLRLVITLSRPSREVKHLWKLMQSRLEKINFGFGIERMALIASRLGPLPHQQLSGWRDDRITRTESDAAFGQMLDVLLNRLGGDRVLRIEPAGGHIPKRSFRLRSAAESSRRRGRDAPATAMTDQPSILLAQPEPIQVMATTPDGPPQWLCWRGVEQRIVSSAGPMRLAPQWWKGRSDEATRLRQGFAGAGERRSDEGTRDYFKVQDEAGRWLWVFRRLDTSRWFVHGVWT